jgi:hypothetical protein
MKNNSVIDPQVKRGGRGHLRPPHGARLMPSSSLDPLPCAADREWCDTDYRDLLPGDRPCTAKHPTTHHPTWARKRCRQCQRRTYGRQRAALPAQTPAPARFSRTSTSPTPDVPASCRPRHCAPSDLLRDQVSLSSWSSSRCSDDNRLPSAASRSSRTAPRRTAVRRPPNRTPNVAPTTRSLPRTDDREAGGDGHRAGRDRVIGDTSRGA